MFASSRLEYCCSDPSTVMEVKLELLEKANSVDQDPCKFGRILNRVVQQGLQDARTVQAMPPVVPETQMQDTALESRAPNPLFAGAA